MFSFKPACAEEKSDVNTKAAVILIQIDSNRKKPQRIILPFTRNDKRPFALCSLVFALSLFMARLAVTFRKRTMLDVSEEARFLGNMRLMATET